MRASGADDLRPGLDTDVAEIEKLLAAKKPAFELLEGPAQRLYRTGERLVWMSEVELGREARFTRDARMMRDNAARLWDAAKQRNLEKARESWRRFKISFGYCYPVEGETPRR